MDPSVQPVALLPRGTQQLHAPLGVGVRESRPLIDIGEALNGDAVEPKKPAQCSNLGSVNLSVGGRQFVGADDQMAFFIGFTLFHQQKKVARRRPFWNWRLEFVLERTKSFRSTQI